MEFHSFVYILLLLTVKIDKMKLMLGDNLINDEHSVPIIITSDMIIVFCERLSCVQRPMETIYK